MAIPFIEQEICEQPHVLANVLQATRTRIHDLIDPGEYRRVHLFGCGDMYFAANVVAWLARTQLGADVYAWRSMESRWIRDGLSGQDLAICASVSGRTPRTLEAARHAREAGARVIGITDCEDAPISGEVDGLALLGTSPKEALGAGPYPGYHHQVAQTKTYTAALMAGMLAVIRAAGRRVVELDGVPGQVDRAIADLLAEITAQAEVWFEGRQRISVIASGPQRGTALYGAAKFLEYAVPAHAQCIEEFNHLELFLADEETLALVLAADGNSVGRVKELLEPWEKLGIRSVVVGRVAEYPGSNTGLIPLSPDSPWTGAFLEALALQILAYRGAVALGRDPDAWLGGVRTKLLNETSRRTIRGSK
jgi:glucosamine--fructose-6-phosphate aminotransferase (isomerizing)